MPFTEQNPDMDKTSYKFVCNFVRRSIQEQQGITYSLVYNTHPYLSIGKLKESSIHGNTLPNK